MTPELIAALEALARRELTQADVDALGPLVAARDDHAVAAILSVGRVRVETRMVTERGVLSALGAEDGDIFLSALESIKAPQDLPAPLQSKYGAIRRAVGWLAKDGIDVADPLTRGLLDVLAATGVIQVSSAQAIKALAERPDPVTADQVSAALGGDSIQSHDGVSVDDLVRVLAPFDASFPGPRRVLAITRQEGEILYRITGGWEMRREHLEVA